MGVLNPQPLPPGGAIKVHVPAEVLFDLEAFQKVQASVLARAGCRGCTSGGHFIWQAYEDFVVNGAGEVEGFVPTAAGSSRMAE
jgi:hypothetical protein